MIEFCQATPKNFPEIQLVAYQTWPVAFRGILSPEQISYMLKLMYSQTSLSEQMTVKGHRFLLANTQNLCVGFGSYELNYNGNDTTKIHKLYILPSAQGKGLGKQIINCVMEQAMENNNELLSLNVNRNNKAVCFYEKLGFKKIRDESTPIGRGFVMEDIVMEKNIRIKATNQDRLQECLDKRLG